MTPVSELTIDLNAVAANYRALQARVGQGVSVAGVVKANGYGLGMTQVIQTLLSCDCPMFYVAQLTEAIRARSVTGRMIAVFAGPTAAKELDDYRAHKIIPIINTPEQLDWVMACAPELPIILQLDTGMNRLGLSAREVEKFCAKADVYRGLTIHHLLSHFACSDEKDHLMNAAQATEFARLVSMMRAAVGRDIPASLANSPGIFRDTSYHHQIVRPGYALYGGNPTPEVANPMQPVVRMDARILQVRDEAPVGATAGYGATYTMKRPTKIATIGLGYADGFLRSFSNQGQVYWQGVACPVIGRVSMDLTIVDITDIPASMQQPQIGWTMEVIGPCQSIEDLAVQAGTIGYEILTQLSVRAARTYVPVKGP